MIYSISILFPTFFPKKSENTGAIIDFETVHVFKGYNDVPITGDQGTLFYLKDDLKAKTKIFYRFRASYTINSCYTLSLLNAPL